MVNQKFGNKSEMNVQLLRLPTITTINTSNTAISIPIPFQILLFSCIASSIVLVNGLNDYNIADDDIINLPVSKFPEPDCKYRVRSHNRNGAELKREVGIGEPVYHHWTCNYKQQQQNGLFCILVNNCTISNPRPNFFPVSIIDKFGCSLFPAIMPNVEYDGDLEGGLQTNIFLLDIDQSSITFHCNINLLLKSHGICQRPLCPPVHRYLRRLQRSSFSSETTSSVPL
uniref:ZP domain-containing protein n=1 Tax=Wuchereria bancrofti TaxID=6293 RepID=A0A1I8EJU3_WUCBA